MSIGDSEKRVALVVGNGAYLNAMPLRNPRNDAQGMSGVLLRLGFNVVSGLDLSRDAMEDKLVEFEVAIGGSSAAVLFYAGHGLQVKGHNYLIPVDADIKQEIQLKRRAFSLDELLEIMVRRARASLIFLDACRDNPFSRSLLSGISEEEQKRYMVRSGLAEVKASQGSFIAFATAPDSVAGDGKGSNSPFTAALLAHIETPDQSVSDLMIEVRKDVLRATGGAQEPWDQSSLRERFCFRSVEPWNITPPIPEPQHGASGVSPIDDRTVEHTYWLNIQSSQNPCAFEAFLAKFSQGDYAGLARVHAEAQIKACDEVAVLEQLERNYPQSERLPLVRDRLMELEWNRARDSQNLTDVEAFIMRWPGSRFEGAARKRLEVSRHRSEHSAGGVRWRAMAGMGAMVVVLVGGYTLWPHRNTSGEKQMRVEDDRAFDAAKRRGSKGAFEAYLGKYRRHSDEARAQLSELDAADYKAAKRKNTVEAFKKYRAAWPEGQYFEWAGERIAVLEAAEKVKAAAQGARESEDDMAFDATKRQGTKAAFEAYLKKYTRHAEEARKQLVALEAETERKKAEGNDDKAFDAAKRAGTKTALETYLRKYGRHTGEARRRLDDLDMRAFETAKRINTVPSLKAYRDKWPNGKHSAEAARMIAEVREKVSSDTSNLKICNTTPSRVGVAIGYKGEKEWVTEGWWNISSNTCETILKGTLTARYYYIHAIDYDRGGAWQGKSFMCTRDKSFMVRGHTDCQRRGYKRTAFFEVDTKDSKGWTVKLTDPK